ncbi:MAG: nucleotide disphospho-sugar-binding domain-containing protein [Solirubrobacteraceae bacterium]
MPVPGHVNPTLPVVRELVRRGHRVRYFTSDALRGAVAAAGAEVVSYGDAVGSKVMRPPRSFPGLARETIALGRVVLPSVLDELQADEPDLVVYDSMCTWGYEAVQHRRGFCFTATVALHPSFLVDAPADFVHRGEHPTAVFTSRDFQPRPELFEGDVRWVGYPPAGAPGLAHRSLAYAALGTLFNERPEVFRAIGQALHGKVVMAVGRADPGAIGPLPPRVRAVPWVDDQAALLRRARLFVSHGGMNSVSEALCAGTPLLVLPQTAEQAVNARRVAELGAGRMLCDDQPSANAIRAEAETVLASDAPARAAALGRTLAAPGPEAAADAVEAAL